MEKVNLDMGRVWYFGISPHRRISVFFKTKKRMMVFYNNLMKWQKAKDKYLTKVERQKQYIYKLVK